MVVAVVEERSYSDKKIKFAAHLEECLATYKKALIVNADNVSSNQMHQIRAALRANNATMIMGKNTLMKSLIRKSVKRTGNDTQERLADLLKLNVGIVFTNGDLKTTRDVLLANRVDAPARSGAMAPLDVFVPAGPTGLEPTQTAFFQALNINTKITKGAVEIVADTQVIWKDTRVTPGAAVLLKKLNIMPFSYGLVLVSVYDNGAVMAPEVLDISSEDVGGAMQEAIKNVAALSMATNQLNKASFVHVLMGAYKRVCSLAVAGDEFSFPRVDKLKAMLADPSAFAVAAAPAAGGAAAAPAAAKAEEPEEEEDEDMGFGLFD